MDEVTTVGEVHEFVQRIERAQGDWEIAHSLEDHLYASVLRAIATGVVEAEEAQEMAEVALQTKSFDFPRYTS